MASTNIKSVNAEGLSPPGGHYSHVNIAGNLAFLSGQLPIDPSGKVLSDQPFKDQVQRVLDNIDACLRQIGASRSSLVQIRVFVTDMEHWKDFDILYKEWIGEHRPSRAVVGASELHFGTLIEVEAVAVISG
ncbi:MAG TPA: RidA family protein [Mesorhizobium sp.]